MSDNILDDHLLPSHPSRFDFSELPPDAIIEITSFSFEHEAMVAQALLWQSGIPCFISNANITNILSGYTPGLGGIGLHILKSSEEAARKVLKDNKNAPIEDEATAKLFEEAEKELALMNAEEEATSKKNYKTLIWVSILFFIFILILSILLPIF